MSRLSSDENSPASVDWEACAWTRLGSQWVFVLTARTTTGQFGKLPFNIRMFNETREALGLELFSRKGQLKSQGETLRVVLTSGGQIVLRLGSGTVASFTSENLPEIGTPKSVPVIFTTGTVAHKRNFAQSIQAMVDGGFVSGGRADVLDLRAAEPWPASELGTFSSAGGGTATWPEASSVVIVDQNFLIELDRCIKSSNSKYWNHLRDAMAWLSACDVIPGFALSECSYGLDGPSNAAALRAAFNAWWFFATASATVEEVREKYQENLSSSSNLLQPPEDARSMLIDLNYLGVLTAAKLWQQRRGLAFKPKERIEDWKSWMAVMNRDGIGISAYLAGVVRHLFLCTDEHHKDAAKLLKLTKIPTRKDLLGSAWDLTYLLIADFARTGQLEETSGKPTVLLTIDKPLAATARSSFLVGMTDPTENAFGLVAYDDVISEKFSTEQRQEIDDLQIKNVQEQLRRAENPYYNSDLIQMLIDQTQDEVQWRSK